MPFRDLREFMAALEQRGELHRVAAEVDPLLEIAAVTDRVSKGKEGKALLFQRVKGGLFPVATNLFGSYGRTACALDVDDIRSLVQLLEKRLKRADFGATPLHRIADEPGWRPVIVPEPPCHEVVERTPNLSSYPILQSWPEDGDGDGGRFLTLPLVFTRDREDASGNCGIYRMRIFGETAAGINWRRGSGGYRHFEKYRTVNEPMPVAVALGGPPALIFAGAMPLPDDVDELAFAGMLQDSPVELAQCLTVPLKVPARAEIVLEGYVDPGDLRQEGRFGNHTGFYAESPPVPVMRMTCITRRHDAIYPATVVGPPPMEDCYMAKGLERLLLPLLRQSVPQVVDLNMPLEWIFQPCMVVAVAKSFPGEGKEILYRLRQEPLLKSARLLMVVDKDVDVQDLSFAAWKGMNCIDFGRDLVFFEGGDGASLGVDATRKLPEETEGPRRREIKPSEGITRLLAKRWKEYGF